MQFPFLTPRVERLLADGSFQAVHEGGVIGRFRSPVVLLSRGMCAFSLFEAAALPRAHRRQAARLHAQVASPYVAGTAMLVNAGQDFGIWWWDLERIAPMIQARYGTARPAVRPETLAQPLGAGWRIVQLTEGSEGQFWNAGTLRASGWRKDRYDAAAWTAFARQVRGAEPPETIPPHQPMPIALDSEAFSLARTEITREQAIGMGLAGVATTVAAVVMFMLGQGATLRNDAQTIEAEALEIRAATPRASDTQGLELSQQRLVAYRTAEERTNPVSAAGAAIGIAALYDLTPRAVDIDEGILTLTLPYVATRSIDSLVDEFEGSGYFFDVRPRTDVANDALIIEMQVREAAPPLTGAG